MIAGVFEDTIEPIKKTGNKVWVKDHVKGDGELEQRIYGTKPASEVLLIPKMIECEREVRVGVKNKNSYAQDEIVYMDESKPEPKSQSQAVLVIKKRGILEYIKYIIAKFRKIIKK